MPERQSQNLTFLILHKAVPEIKNFDFFKFFKKLILKKKLSFMIKKQLILHINTLSKVLEFRKQQDF